MDGNKELPASKEAFSTAKQTIALQTRLILGNEALNPNNVNIGKVNNENLKGISQETFNKLSNASTNERSDYWKNKSGSDTSLTTYEAQMKSWTADFVKYVDQENFTEKNALDLYNHYFVGESKSSAIDKFVNETVLGLTLQNENVDLEALNQEMPKIKKLANIFGGNSSELIEASILAKIKLMDNGKKQELITQSNEEIATSQGPQTRLDYLNPDEERILKWLDQNQTLDTKRLNLSRKPQTGEYYWKYKRLEGDIRIFPKELTYAKLAEDLKNSNPQAFGHHNMKELSIIVEKQLAETQAQLDKFGLTQQELKQLSLDFVDKEVLTHYREFIQKNYHINLPATEEIQILPVSGPIAKAHDNTGKGLAFVNVEYPVIFLNIDNIAGSAQRILGKSWNDLSLMERKQYFRRLLTEIHPHEYTHLLGDLAFWELAKKGQPNIEQEIESFTGRLGLKIAKPRNLQEDGKFSYLERGRGLMEAVTVELTDQWVKSMGEDLTKIYGRPTGMKLDIPAYPGERQILYALENLISQDQGIKNDKAFEIFVRAYFTKDGFREIVNAIDDRKKVQGGKLITRRPHFTSIVYSLMQYEANKTTPTNTAKYYPLTQSFIYGNLSLEQKQEILTNVNNLNISPTIKSHLNTLLISTVPTK